jgi:hypothetical protein
METIKRIPQTSSKFLKPLENKENPVSMSRTKMGKFRRINPEMFSRNDISIDNTHMSSNFLASKKRVLPPSNRETLNMRRMINGTFKRSSIN